MKAIFVLASAAFVASMVNQANARSYQSCNSAAFATPNTANSGCPDDTTLVTEYPPGSAAGVYALCTGPPSTTYACTVAQCCTRTFPKPAPPSLCRPFSFSISRVSVPPHPPTFSLSSRHPLSPPSPPNVCRMLEISLRFFLTRDIAARHTYFLFSIFLKNGFTRNGLFV